MTRMAEAGRSGSAGGGLDRTPGDVTADTIRGHGDVVDAARPVFRPKNRPDIDGLRALAVIPVVLFHAEFAYFSGGYVGVDVFFVISGFLITAILHREMKAGTFSLVGFYERRSRRILPALFAMMALVAPLCWLTLLAKDLADFGQSVVAATTFAANILFYIKTDYFDAPALTKPLLHTWSLAVEEQFYIFFPLILFAAMRWARRWTFAIVAGLLLGSFAVGFWQAVNAPSAAFYLPLGRAWELMVGSLLALGLIERRLPQWALELCALAGLALVVASILLLDSQSLFPGPGALAPCIGTALLIYAGAGERLPLVSRALANRLFVFIGLISYSLYLWHWPIIVLWEYRFLPSDDALDAALLLGLIFLLSVLSWKYVELPVREGRILGSRRSLFAAVAAGMAAFVLLGSALALGRGFPERLPDEVQSLEQARLDRPEGRNCTRFGDADGFTCEVGAAGEADFLVWGDSHAITFWSALEAAGRTTGRSGLIASANGCPPLLGLERRGQERDCGGFNRRVVDMVRERNIGTVFLVGNWPTYLEAREVSGAGFGEGLEATLSALRGRRVFVVARVPGGRFDVPSGLARKRWFGASERMRLTVPEYAAEQGPSIREFRRLRRQHRFTILYPHRRLCRYGRCMLEANGQILYSDQHHLTPAAGRLLEPMFVRALQQRAANPNRRNAR